MRGERARRGLSPLIATVLLIAFAVAIGTLIMSWTVEAPAKHSEDACTPVRLTLQEVPGGQAICYDQSDERLRFVVKNTGDSNIPMLVLRVVGSDFEVLEREVTANLAVGAAGSFDLPYTTTSPQAVTASVMPTVDTQGKRQACPSKEIERVSVPRC